MRLQSRAREAVRPAAADLFGRRLKARAAEGAVATAREVKKIKIKLADKRAALVDLGRHHKLFTDKFEHGGKEGARSKGRSRSSL
jgi:hypothetical protein